MSMQTANLNQPWFDLLKVELEQGYMQSLFEFLRSERVKGKVVFPEFDTMFAALNATPIESVKVVILGQDPYHGPNQAHGLSFSVLPGVKVPPSLKNIYKELHNDIGCSMPVHGHLVDWANQGVLLLNSVLSVEQANAGSHQAKGWERFTDKVIELVNLKCENVVFMLWGGYAQSKCSAVDKDRHLVLTAPHPSPLSAYRGFLGCGHFSKANAYLLEHNKHPIDWQVQ